MSAGALDPGLMRCGPIFAQRWSIPGARLRGPLRATHPYAALTFHISGRSSVETRGPISLSPGDVLLLPAGAPHRLAEAQDIDFWGIGFFPSSLPSHDLASLLSPFDRVRSGALGLAQIPVARRDVFGSLCRELELACLRTDSGAPIAQRSLLILVLDEIGRAMGSTSQTLAPSLAGECLRIIEQRCLRPLTVEEIASELRRSPSHIVTALRQQTGQTPHQWIVSLRMAEARRLLLHTDEHVDTISERVGYRDTTGFIRAFRRQHGETPAAFRARAVDPVIPCETGRPPRSAGS